MSDTIYGHSGFEALCDILENYIDKADNAIEALVAGAEEFVNDALKLPKPISKIRKAGYTHLVHSFSYRVNKNEVEAGWGKYYGPMVEHGTVNMDANPHLQPLFDRNKEKYYKTMLTKLGFQTW